MSLTVRTVVSADDLAACLTLRRRVFIDEQRVPEELELDGDDDACTHFLVADAAGTPVATARMRLLTDPATGAKVAKAQRVAVDAGRRREGVGALVMRALEDAARASSATSVKLSSQVHALPFYERQGYVAHGDVYDDAGIPHRDMTKSL
jgi:ElaA protein